MITWKPIILYQKRPFIPTEYPFKDAVISRRPDKYIHEWKEDTIPILHVIKALTKEGDTILDPMAGTGTTVEACLMLNRRCIAVEKDEELYEMLLKRFC
jgi:DNA modification methylase